MIEEQIEKIYQDFKQKFITSSDWGFEFSTNDFKEWLANLLTKSNEEAVKNTILSIMSKVPTIMPHDKPDYILRSDFDRAIKETEKQFLTQQSLDKGEDEPLRKQ